MIGYSSLRIAKYLEDNKMVFNTIEKCFLIKSILGMYYCKNIYIKFMVQVGNEIKY